MASVGLWFLLGTVGMAIGTLVLAFGLRWVPRSDWGRYALVVTVPFIALVAYGLMALGIGGVYSQEGALIFLPRYVDWLLTTPIHVVYVGLLAGVSTGIIYRAASLEAATIGLGLAGALAAPPFKWILFLAGSATFAGVIYYAYVDYAEAADELSAGQLALFQKLRAFMIVLWLVYPFIWLLAPSGIGLMDVETTTLVTAYIDVVAKVGFGLIALNGYLGTTATEGSSQESPEAATTGTPAD